MNLRTTEIITKEKSRLIDAPGIRIVSNKISAFGSVITENNNSFFIIYFDGNAMTFNFDTEKEANEILNKILGDYLENNRNN